MASIAVVPSARDLRWPVQVNPHDSDFTLIGAAEASLHEQPDAWRDWGSQAEVLQHLKQLWHVLVHYGLPARGTRDPT